ncbi:MAG: porin, partial [Chitinophagaceae bacterium]
MKKLLTAFLLYTVSAFGQSDSTFHSSIVNKPKPKWFENISIRGYMQVRYNRLLETNPQLKCDQCDRSWGENGGVFIRRMRIILYGQIHERVYFYIQPDFASAPTTSAQNFAQLRDAYFDLGIDKKNEFRLRLGQSKIPYGFENMQSSQNRLPLDRNDGLNSAIANERDLGGFFYWAPAKTRKLFSSLVSEGLKGSGDYGVFGFGVYNGQTANRPEQNNNLHIVSRITYPISIGNQ